MIFGTVGTHPSGYQRLVDMLDAVAARGEELVMVQIGNTPRPPKHAEWFRFDPSPHAIGKRAASARAVVCHAGAGTVIEILSSGVPIIVVPRRKALREHNDDNQEEFAAALERAGYATVARNEADLAIALTRLRERRIPSSCESLVAYLTDLTNEWDPDTRKPAQ